MEIAHAPNSFGRLKAALTDLRPGRCLVLDHVEVELSLSELRSLVVNVLDADDHQGWACQRRAATVHR